MVLGFLEWRPDVHWHSVSIFLPILMVNTDYMKFGHGRNDDLDCGCLQTVSDESTSRD
jgi:hypothetical protein